ncbi:MAG: universal stress protein [Syntrophobacterales bacterium]|nr:universal stress protein [Syntrophobacterales bacterium]
MAAVFQRLLVGTDGSPASEGAVQAALSLARASACEVFLLEVLEVNPGFSALAPEALVSWEREAHSSLEEVRSRARAQGVALTPLVRTAEAAYAAIVEEAGRLKADLILLGRHGKTGLARLLLGSVAARTIGLSPVNVLIVPADTPLAWERLLVASDGSPFSEAAWAEALRLARHWGSRLYAVSVAREEGELPQAEAIVREMLAQANAGGLPLESRVTVGVPDDAIVRTAREVGASLILLGSHGRTGFTRLLLGSVAERVIGTAPCPVLVVKRPSRKE